MRLIDANALEGEAFCLYTYGGARYISLAALKRAKTIDAEPVVRCKDCKEYYKGKCDNVLGLPNPYPHSFCSFGERRSDEA